MAGLLGDVANTVGGVFGASSNAPQLQIAPVDPGTRQLMDQGIARATRPTSEFAADINKGAAEGGLAAGQMTPSDSAAMAGSGMDAGMGHALRQAYTSQAGNMINQIMDKNKMSAEFAKQDYLNKQVKLVMGQAQVAAQTNQMLTDAYNQQEMARAGLITSLFQTAGTAMAIGAARSRRAAKPAAEGAAPTSYNVGSGVNGGGGVVGGAMDNVGGFNPGGGTELG